MESLLVTEFGLIGYAEETAGPATPIVFLHGVGSDKTVWRRQLEFFGQQRRSVAIDYPGYGDSDLWEGATRDDFASWILAGMDALKIGRAHVCGLSLGGVIAIAMHHQAADRIVSLILADSFADHPDGAGIYERSVAGSSNMRAFAEARADVLLAQPADPLVRREVIDTMAGIAPAAYVIGAEAVWLANQRDRAHDIRVPTLVLCGSEDRPTPPALSTALTKLIPGARCELIERAGHLTNIEQPDAFNTLVSAFIRGVDSRS